MKSFTSFSSTCLPGLAAACLLIACAEPSPEPSPAPEVTLEAMTFNIRYANPGDGEHRWDLRKDRVADVIRSNGPDVVGLQEALRHQLDTLMVRLPEYGWVGQGRDDGRDAGEFSPILYRRDRIRVLSTGTFWLSPTPERVGSVGWDAALPRIATWAALRHEATGTVLFHVNTHFDHVGEEARLESARLIREQIGRIAGDAPFVVTGDFNAVDTSPPYEALTTPADSLVRLVDSREAADQEDLTTFRGFEVGSATTRRIDYVFFSRHFEILQHRVLDEDRDGSYPSDHLPVVSMGRLRGDA